MLALISADWLGRLRALSLFYPSRFKTWLTVAAETPTLVAISLPGMRCRRRLRSVRLPPAASAGAAGGGASSDPVARPGLLPGSARPILPGPCDRKRLRLPWQPPSFAH